MQIRIHNRAQQGSVLLLALMVSALAGLALASYLVLAQTQNVSVYRSQNWNASMALTEAGVEDALQLINRNAGSFDPEVLFQWTNNTAADSWDKPAANVFHVRRFITNSTVASSVTSYYDVWITNNNNVPTITSVGFVPWTF